LSAQSRRRHHAALKFLSARTLGRPAIVAFLGWPKDADRLPPVLSISEVRSVLGAFREPKYLAFFMLIRATGMRLNEACMLETRDIDAARGVIHVRHAKGRRERLVMLGAALLKTLRTYWSLARPPAPWLFTTCGGRFQQKSRAGPWRAPPLRSGFGLPRGC
jgi:integrase/recombinase XerD